MKVAPFESCVACYRGDTTTAVVARGEAEFIVGVMSRIAGMSVEEATATFGTMAQHEFGCDPGFTPVGRLTIPIRICRACAAANGVPAAAVVNVSDLIAGKATPCYEQSGGDDSP